MSRIHHGTPNTESLEPSCGISPKTQDHAKNTLFQQESLIFPNITGDKVSVWPSQKTSLFISREGIIWDQGDNFSKFIDRESLRGAFHWSIQTGCFYKNVIVDNDWKNISKQSNPELWKLLTNDNGKEFNIDDQADSDDDIEINKKLEEREKKMPSLPFLTVMHNIDGLNIFSSEIVKFMFFSPQNSIGKCLHFLKNILQE